MLVVGATRAQDENGVARTGAPLINAQLEKAWEENGLKPASACTDLEFIRRVTLDITGTVPSLERVRSFVNDTASGKRARLVDELLASDRYVENWTMLWNDILTSMSPTARFRDQGAAEAFRAALKARIAKNQPWNEFVKELLSSTASWSNDPETAKTASEGLIMWYAQFDQNRAGVMASSVSKVFLGVQIQCAECHDHPFDKWTQEDFKSMAAWFVPFRVDRKPVGEMPADKKKARDQKTLYTIVDENPAKGDPKRAAPARQKGNNTPNNAEPKFLDGAERAAGLARRPALAAWLTSKENRQFAKETVNRLWNHFFGRGIVHPFDDFTLRNKPASPALLDAVADDFAANGYDMKKMIRAITMSKAYQLASTGREVDSIAEKFFARTQIRSLSPEQLFNAVVDATTVGQADYASGADGRGNKGGRGGGGRREFLQTFRGARNEADAAAEPEIGVPQALYLMNGNFLSAASKAGAGSQLSSILAAHKIPGERIEAIYLSLLCRKPTGSELARAVRYLEQAAARKAEAPAEPPARGKRPAGPAPDAAGYEDLVWSLLNSTEFQSNH
jgi:hypothetical protein